MVQGPEQQAALVVAALVEHSTLMVLLAQQIRVAAVVGEVTTHTRAALAVPAS